MYISNEQIHALDVPVKDFEVALRSLVSDVMLQKFGSATDYQTALLSISVAADYIFAQKINPKLANLKKRPADTYKWLESCKEAFENKNYSPDSPYVSELMDLIFIFFNSAFSGLRLAEKFSSVDEFYYSCIQYHKIRNSLSHPATNPIPESEALRVANFIENLTSVIEDKYFWYQNKSSITASIHKFKNIKPGQKIKASNIEYSRLSHKNLFCREDILAKLYESVAGSATRRRLAGSVVLYGYGGVGKTAVVTEFLLRLAKDKSDGLYEDLEFLLFFSSKDEYLRLNQTAGTLYIDQNRPEFSSLNELEALLYKSLTVTSIDDIEDNYKRGIVVIDNIENIDPTEKEKIIEFTKNVPRCIQFILTSRNEENCEEKIHVKGFSDKTTGEKFVSGILEEQDVDSLLNYQQIEKLLEVSTGNALVIIQIINALQTQTATFETAIAQIESMKSKTSEVIANFMFKNTFDSVIAETEKRNLPARLVLQFFSLYGEPLELYSISKLAKLKVADAEALCDALLSRIVIVKKGEYYEMNEFARRFIHLKLIVDRVEEANLKSQIRNHKENVKRKLEQFNSILDEDTNLRRIIDEWQPRNYIDKMIISDLFLIYNQAQSCSNRKDKTGYSIKIAEVDDCDAISSHPYVNFQKARVLKLGYDRLSIRGEDVISKISQCYEMALEAIMYDYRYLIGTPAHSSLLIVFGIFLINDCKEYGRSIRLLEDAANQLNDSQIDKKWYLCHRYLAKALLSQYEKKRDDAYKHQLLKITEKIIRNENVLLKKKISMDSFKKILPHIQKHC